MELKGALGFVLAHLRYAIEEYKCWCAHFAFGPCFSPYFYFYLFYFLSRHWSNSWVLDISLAKLIKNIGGDLNNDKCLLVLNMFSISFFNKNG